ncbi:hypothetical protein H920_01770 [Fukomys damarensis]|uniref:Uncharacterized protein n=1 Tax=Fukomys damarensis TaxID=885580 RepID=A0A091DXI3_FUKDA|nr:hypothetical protein H920_01770 [Fukomys damarensis]
MGGARVMNTDEVTLLRPSLQVLGSQILEELRFCRSREACWERPSQPSGPDSKDTLGDLDLSPPTPTTSGGPCGVSVPLPAPAAGGLTHLRPGAAAHMPPPQAPASPPTHCRPLESGRKKIHRISKMVAHRVVGSSGCMDRK